MLKFRLILTASLLGWVSIAVCAEQPALAGLRKQVADTERDFAETMALRDFEGFLSFLSDEAVFFSGSAVLRGKQQIGDAWKPYYEKPDAPFSWAPEQVEVLTSGTLALSSGPIHDADGNIVARFNSVWQLDASGNWRIIFDKGSDVCNCSGQ